MEDNQEVTPPKVAWSLSEISRAMGLSVGFLRNEQRAGRLPVKRFGRRIVVLNDDLQAYLQRGSRGNTDVERIGG